MYSRKRSKGKKLSVFDYEKCLRIFKVKTLKAFHDIQMCSLPIPTQEVLIPKIPQVSFEIPAFTYVRDSFPYINQVRKINRRTVNTCLD